MYVVATAGHVDHGKSTLVRALTGQDPDRWDEEKRRGLTIDLGFVWTTLASGRNVAFVDVPGHERFIGNMLAGLAPVNTVLFVIAADEGWQQQTEDHFAAVRALGIRHGLVVLTRADRATAERLAEVRAQVARKLEGSGLADAEVIAVSAKTSDGMAELRAALDRMLAGLPHADPDAAVRMWLDRSFSITGAGTVVTGTLTAGTVAVGDQLELVSKHGERTVEVRGVQSEETAQGTIGPVNRVALNLRSVDKNRIHRGDALLTPGAWWLTQTLDAAVVTRAKATELPRELAVHVGTAELQGRLRALGEGFVRVHLPRRLPLRRGDRMVLRAPGGHEVLAGIEIVDVDPPELSGRGAGKRRGDELSALDAAAEVARYQAVRRADLVKQGWRLPEDVAQAGMIEAGGWLLSRPAAKRWVAALRESVATAPALNPGVARDAAVNALGLPDAELITGLVAAAGLVVKDGRIVDPRAKVDLGPAEEGIAQIEEWLAEEPFRAPEADELADLKLGPKQLAAAERAGRIIRLGSERSVILLPDAPQRARAVLGGIEQPFTLSQARRALDTTRRIAVPLLEHLDGLGMTRRLDGNLRVVR
ncbi:translation elongation factor [Corynebacterium atypicum]|uniref:Translation elongation factor n=1 Tax=Corynebacterium atypicum TaxID=191610 RepID=A0ABM5QNH4_9CORY|nr:selenocysteine-specific translation elongation factor [Corynebacterium atypicum]AIG64376.1 translation elongation factor [Corynebacterium atypicum]